MSTPVIEVANLCKRYGDRLVVDDVSFDVRPGEIFGILGRNGAGKSTTVECIEGLRRPDGGTIRVLGLDPRRDRAALRERVGVQLQESQLPDGIRVWEALDLYASFYHKPADWRPLVDQLGLADQRNTPFRKLSGGQKQRLSAALALVGNPEIAVLDELTSGLDPHARREAWELVEGIRERGVTVVLVTHFMDEAERLCDRVALLEAGRMIAVDTPAGLVSRVDAEQRIRFRPSKPLPEGLLAGLPEVTGLEMSGPWVVVKGEGNLLLAVAGVLVRADVVALELRVERGTLEDAFIALTGHGLEADMAATA